MSTEPALTLGEYIRALIEALGAEHPGALDRMKQVVGNRRAAISLDDESVEVWFGAEGLRVEVVSGAPATGAGATDSTTVLDLLAGVIEVPDAILDGRLRVTGELEEIGRMFQAIEILLDASPRTPRLQALADRFVTERSAPDRALPPATGGSSWYPFACSARELDLLRRLDLLRGDLDEL